MIVVRPEDVSVKVWSVDEARVLSSSLNMAWTGRFGMRTGQPEPKPGID